MRETNPIFIGNFEENGLTCFSDLFSFLLEKERCQMREFIKFGAIKQGGK